MQDKDLGSQAKKSFSFFLAMSGWAWYNVGMKATPKLSQPSKMPCKSWSLPAWTTCPGARNADGSAVDACSMCYALQGRYTFGAVKEVRDHNLSDWTESDWTDAMVKAIGKGTYFRWFDSGDIYSPELAEKIFEVCQRTPNCAHWIPTRAYKDSRIVPFLDKLNALPNVVVRLSSDSIDGETIEGDNTSTIVESPEDFVSGKGRVLCRAYTRAGKCGNCRACFDKRVKIVFYPRHGRKVKTIKAAEYIG